jgi:hypothetical protein
MPQQAFVIVRATVESSHPDRVQYKPYDTTLTFGGKLHVEIRVPVEMVVEQKGDHITLSLEGWTNVLNQYTTAVETMHQNYIRKAYQR